MRKRLVHPTQSYIGHQSQTKTVLKYLQTCWPSNEKLWALKSYLSGNNKEREGRATSLPAGQFSSLQVHLPQNLTKRKRTRIKHNCFRTVVETHSTNIHRRLDRAHYVCAHLCRAVAPIALAKQQCSPWVLNSYRG